MTTRGERLSNARNFLKPNSMTTPNETPAQAGEKAESRVDPKEPLRTWELYQCEFKRMDGRHSAGIKMPWDFAGHAFKHRQPEIDGLKMHLQIMENFYRAAMDRANKAEEEIAIYRLCDGVLDGDPAATDEPTHMNILRLMRERREARDKLAEAHERERLLREERDELLEDKYKLVDDAISLSWKIEVLERKLAMAQQNFHVREEMLMQEKASLSASSAISPQQEGGQGV